MLRHALATHPAIRAANEVLAQQNAWYTESNRELVYAYCQYEITDATTRLPVRLWAKNDYMELVDRRYDFCKLLYHQITPQIRNWLSDRSVLHLTRDNYLACFVSTLVAHKHGFLASVNQDQDDLQPVTVSLQSFDNYCQHYDNARKPWAARETIRYIDMLHNWDATVRKVQEFIGVVPLPLQQTIPKRIQRPLREMVTNSDELEAAGYGHWLNGE